MRKILNKINSLLAGDIDNVSFQDIYEDATKYNRNIAVIFSTFAAILITIMFVISLFRQEFHSSRTVYGIGVAISCLILILAHLGRKNSTYTWSAVYIAETFYLSYGLSIGLITRQDTQTTTFMVMMVLLPIIFVDKPARTNIILAFYIISFSIGAYLLKDDSVKYVDIIDALIFGFLAVISGTAVNYLRIKGFILEDRLKVMSETDQLTGLKNRNSFEWNLEKYSESDKEQIACVYIDVNGLHEINNTHGHKTGDEMLQYIAKKTQEAFGEDHTYRIGGDEYVTFIFDGDADELLTSLQSLSKNVSAAGYHIAVGYSIQKDKVFNIHELIKDAEKMMYKQKDIYYSKLRKRSRA